MYRVQVYTGISLSSLETIDKLARERGVSRATIIGEEVEAYLKNLPEEG